MVSASRRPWATAADSLGPSAGLRTTVKDEAQRGGVGRGGEARGLSKCGFMYGTQAAIVLQEPFFVFVG